MGGRCIAAPPLLPPQASRPKLGASVSVLHVPPPPVSPLRGTSQIGNGGSSFFFVHATAAATDAAALRRAHHPRSVLSLFQDHERRTVRSRSSSNESPQAPLSGNCAEEDDLWARDIGELPGEPP